MFFSVFFFKSLPYIDLSNREKNFGTYESLFFFQSFYHINIWICFLGYTECQLTSPGKENCWTGLNMVTGN